MVATFIEWSCRVRPNVGIWEHRQTNFLIQHIDGSITLHRADVLKVLTSNIPDGLHTHFSKRLVDYSVDHERVAIRFTDGTKVIADLLVGADGLGSATRSVMYRHLRDELKDTNAEKAAEIAKYIQPIWTGTYAYRSLIDPNRLLQKTFSHQAATLPMIVSLFDSS